VKGRRSLLLRVIVIFSVIAFAFSAAGAAFAVNSQPGPYYHSDKPGTKGYILAQLLYGPFSEEEGAAWYIALDTALNFHLVRLPDRQFERCRAIYEYTLGAQTENGLPEPVRISGLVTETGEGERAAAMEAFGAILHVGSVTESNFERYFGACHLDATVWQPVPLLLFFVPTFLCLLILAFLFASYLRRSGKAAPRPAAGKGPADG